MKVNSLGDFVDDSGKEYEVLELIDETEHHPLGLSRSIKRDGFLSYKTACGVDLNRDGDCFVTLEGRVLKSEQ